MRPENNLIRFNAGHRSYKRPFWLPAPAYYVLTLTVAAAIFLLVWGMLHEGEDMPWILAGGAAVVVVAAAVVLREIYLRRSHNRFLLAQKRLDENLNNISKQKTFSNKLTLEKNTSLIENIRRKSEAARVLGKVSDAHLDVFEVCNDYLRLTETELPNVAAGSPRLAAIRRGREQVGVIHKHHLLNWAAIETGHLTREAQIKATVSEKIETAQKALFVLDKALHYYPDEIQFQESSFAVRHLISSIKISHLVEEAERDAFKGNYAQALDSYQDALFYLNKSDLDDDEKARQSNKINGEIEKLRGIKPLETTKKISRTSKKK